VKAVFADTFFFLAILDESDASHNRAIEFSTSNLTMVTTEFILLELGNACSRAEDHADFFGIVGRNSGESADPGGSSGLTLVAAGIGFVCEAG
jgi:hypothetical protein